jgi:hypothetical protein
MSDIVEVITKVSKGKVQAPLELSISDQLAWGELVNKARDFVGRIKSDKMAVATLALKAATLGWGGSRKGQKWDGKIHHYAIEIFAKEVGVARGTLWDWCQVKRLMDRTSLPLEENKLDIEAAKRTVAVVAANPTALPEVVYKAEVEASRQSHYLYQFLQRLRTFRRWAENESDLSKLPTAEIKELKDHILFLHGALSRIRIIER